jgi:hypothetical protein
MKATALHDKSPCLVLQACARWESFCSNTPWLVGSFSFHCLLLELYRQILCDDSDFCTHFIPSKTIARFALDVHSNLPQGVRQVKVVVLIKVHDIYKIQSSHYLYLVFSSCSLWFGFCILIHNIHLLSCGMEKFIRLFGVVAIIYYSFLVTLYPHCAGCLRFTCNSTLNLFKSLFKCVHSFFQVSMSRTMILTWRKTSLWRAKNSRKLLCSIFWRTM